MLSFARDDFDYCNPSAESLFGILLMKAKEFEAVTLTKGIRKNYVFTKKEDVGNIVADDNGAYLVTASATRQFKVNVYWSEDKLEVQGVHMDSPGEFCLKKRVGRPYETVHINKDSVYSVSRYYRKSKSFPGLRQLIVRITPVQKESRIEHFSMVYSLDSVMKQEELSVLPHGNALKRTRPYICTSRKTMDKLLDNLSSEKSVIEVYDLTLEESGGPQKSTSQSQQPRDKKQVQNCKGLQNSKKKQNRRDAEKEQTDEKDEIYEMLYQLREIDIMHLITIKKHCVKYRNFT